MHTKILECLTLDFNFVAPCAATLTFFDAARYQKGYLDPYVEGCDDESEHEKDREKWESVVG